MAPLARYISGVSVKSLRAMLLSGLRAQAHTFDFVTLAFFSWINFPHMEEVINTFYQMICENCENRQMTESKIYLKELNGKPNKID
jgi:hypothetical protein